MLTPNLKLRISSGLTDDAKYNLNRIDSLGSIYQVDTTQTAKVRSQTNILIQPNDPDIGGSGTGGTVSIGTSDQPLTSLSIFADAINLTTGFSILDQATGGTKNLNLRYKSDITGAVDTADDRDLSFDLEGADRNVVLGGNFSINNNLTLVLGGVTNLTLPTSGTVLSADSTATVTNKTISATNNTITNLADSNIAAAAAISGTKISPNFGSQLVETTNSVQATGGFSSTGGVSFKMPSSDGTAGQVVSTDGLGQFGFSTVATTDLDDNHINIGNSSNVEFAVDTTAVGDILADETTGLTLKAGVITDTEVNASAAISVSKLAALTASRALESDGSGVITPSAVTSTELGYLSGVTSALQTQLDAKQDLDSDLTAIAGLITSGIIVRTSVGAATTRSVVAGSGKLTVTNGNGIAGDISVDLGTVDTDDVSEGSNLYFTDERAQDAVGTILTDSSTIDFTYDDALNTITAVTIDSAINHDNLLNFASDEHVAHSGVSVVAAGDSGLSTSNNNLASNIGLTVDINGTTAETSIEGADAVLLYDNSAGALKKASLTNVFAGVALKTFKANWTDADGSSVVITHNIGTLDVRVELYDTADGATIIPDTVVRNSVNQITITGSNLPGTFDFRVLISEV